MGKGKDKSKPKNVAVSKKRDWRELGNSIAGVFRKKPEVKLFEPFAESNVGQAYCDHYYKHDFSALEKKVKRLESKFDQNRPEIGEGVRKVKKVSTPFRRSSSATRTKHDMVEYLEEQICILSAELEVFAPLDPNCFSDSEYPRPDSKQTVQGHYSQANIPFYKRISRHSNSQCTSMAYTAVLASKTVPTNLWTPKMVDRLLVYGDRLHHQSLVDNRWRRGQCERLALDQLQQLPHSTRAEWPVKVLPTKQLYGLVKPRCAEQVEILRCTNGVTLASGIKDCFDSGADGCVLTVGDFSTAVIKDPLGRPCVFDPHGVDKTGRGRGSGKASLLKFEDMEHLLDFCVMKYGGTAEFNIAGLEVQQRAPNKRK